MLRISVRINIMLSPRFAIYLFLSRHHRTLKKVHRQWRPLRQLCCTTQHLNTDYLTPRPSFLALFWPVCAMSGFHRPEINGAATIISLCMCSRFDTHLRWQCCDIDDGMLALMWRLERQCNCNNLLTRGMMTKPRQCNNPPTRGRTRQETDHNDATIY